MKKGTEGGLWIHKRQYRIVRYFDDFDALYLKGVP